MIIWRGWGFLVAVFAFGASLAMELITESITRDDNFYQREAWPLALAFAIAGVITWFLGKTLHERGGRVVIDKATGQELTIDAKHTFFFVPMHYWGVVLIALAGAVLVWSLTVSGVAASSAASAAQGNHPGRGAAGAIRSDDHRAGRAGRRMGSARPRDAAGDRTGRRRRRSRSRTCQARQAPSAWRNSINGRRGDGQALLVNGLVMLGAILWNQSPVSIAQVTPIARLTGEYEVVAVPAASPHRDMQSLVRALRENPAAVSWGGGSAGGTDHILAGLIVAAAGVDPRRTNYIAFSGGGEAVTALIGGQVTAGISGYSEFAQHIESGRLRAIGISAPKRLADLDVPTLVEQGLDVELENWRAVVAPPGLERLPDEQALTAVVERMAHSESWRATLTEARLDRLLSRRPRLRPVPRCRARACRPHRRAPARVGGDETARAGGRVAVSRCWCSAAVRSC